MIEVKIPQKIGLIVSQKYTTLRRKMLRNGGKNYSVQQLKNNIRTALYLNGEYIDPQILREPMITEWKNKGYKVIPYKHWFYAVRIMQDKNGDTIAVAQDTVRVSQTTDSMKTEKKERVAVRAYKATEKAFVEGYEAVENGCVKMFAHKGETTAETKARLQAGVEKSHDISTEVQERSREISQKATGAKAKN